MKTAILLCLFVTLIFSQTIHLNVGGTSCIPDEAETCTPADGSTRVTVVGGVDVSDNECDAGAADTMGVATSFTTETDGFFTVSLRGLGTNPDSAVLIFADEIAEDPCEAVVATDDAWTGFLPAGEYHVVVTSDGGDADACGEFAVTISETVYEFTGVTDTLYQQASDFGFGCNAGDAVWIHHFTFTPEEDGSFLFSGVGRQEGEDTGIVAFVFAVPTEFLPANLSSAGEVCNASAHFVAFDAETVGYPLTADTEYTIAVRDIDTAGEIMVWVNAIMSVDPVYADCDEMDFDDQVDFLRPEVRVVGPLAPECQEGTTEFPFDVRRATFETDSFVVVDTVTCNNPDDDRSGFDQAVVLYYGEVGEVRTDDSPAVAPEDVCENFLIAGDSGDGGAVFYWFPANEPLTIVPTTYSSSGSGVYTLTVDSYDIVGCVPENPYIEVPTDSSNVLAFVASAMILIAML